MPAVTCHSLLQSILSARPLLLTLILCCSQVHMLKDIAGPVHAPSLHASSSDQTVACNVQCSAGRACNEGRVGQLEPQHIAMRLVAFSDAAAGSLTCGLQLPWHANGPMGHNHGDIFADRGLPFEDFRHSTRPGHAPQHRIIPVKANSTVAAVPRVMSLWAGPKPSSSSA